MNEPVNQTVCLKLAAKQCEELRWFFKKIAFACVNIKAYARDKQLQDDKKSFKRAVVDHLDPIRGDVLSGRFGGDKEFQESLCVILEFLNDNITNL